MNSSSFSLRCPHLFFLFSISSCILALFSHFESLLIPCLLVLFGEITYVLTFIEQETVVFITSIFATQGEAPPLESVFWIDFFWSWCGESPLREDNPWENESREEKIRKGSKLTDQDFPRMWVCLASTCVHVVCSAVQGGSRLHLWQRKNNS